MKVIANNRILLCALVPLYGADALCAKTPKSSQLDKVYYHEFSNRRQDNPAYYMEFGKVVFYFDADFEMLPSKRWNNKNNQEVILFSFPATIVKTAECKQMINELNKKKFPSFSINIVNNEAKGVELYITFDPKEVGVDVLSFDSIGRQKGLAFNLVNRKLLDELSRKVDPVLRTASLQKPPHIIIDCGHGGGDAGTVGAFAIKEKDVNLQVGLQLSHYLTKQGVVTHLTRSNDVAIALDARTAFANAKFPVDLIVSIHANHSGDSRVQGVETFCLGSQLLAQQFSTLGKRNSTVMKEVQDELCQKSSRLAQVIHQHVIKSAKTMNKQLVDRTVKRSVSQLLLGSQMPSALIELGFLSNNYEAELLNNPDYQKLLAQGIGNGILSYLSK